MQSTLINDTNIWEDILRIKPLLLKSAVHLLRRLLANVVLLTRLHLPLSTTAVSINLVIMKQNLKLANLCFKK